MWIFIGYLEHYVTGMYSFKFIPFSPLQNLINFIDQMEECINHCLSKIFIYLVKCCDIYTNERVQNE